MSANKRGRPRLKRKYTRRNKPITSEIMPIKDEKIATQNISQPKIKIYNQEYKLEDFKYRMKMCNKADKMIPVKEQLEKDPLYYKKLYDALREKPGYEDINKS